MIARATIWRALLSLPPRRRAVLVMCELEGLSISAVAARLAINVQLRTPDEDVSSPSRILASILIDTRFDIEVGETIVVGTSRVQGDKALVVLLTAVPR